MNPQPNRAAQAAEGIAERCFRKLGRDWREEIQPEELEELAAIIRSHYADAEARLAFLEINLPLQDSALADVEARAQAAEAKLAEVEAWCWLRQGDPALRWMTSEVLAILNREQP